MVGGDSDDMGNVDAFRYMRMLRFLRLARLAKIEVYISDLLAHINSHGLILVLGMIREGNCMEL